MNLARLKIAVAGFKKCLHNICMLKKLLGNYWFQCACEAFVTFCIYFTVIYLGLTSLQVLVHALSN
jgi:hypothetical protein